MQTLEKSSAFVDKVIYRPRIVNNLNDVEIHMVKFLKAGDIFLMQLWVNNLVNNNYCVFLKEQYLTLVISEVKEVLKPVYMHNFNWRHTDHVFYEVMKSVEIWLPGDNFYLVKHYFVPDDKLLNIYLGQAGDE